ncbi:MBL fold metallo-hydrolase [Anaerobacillus sp. MEB173]|uniref:MBL fold metallo-hydrolase n=1 Tax=Anaerobacillus sp. MEB173 TaxID=3383345 RepID=UPI003F8EF0A4
MDVKQIPLGPLQTNAYVLINDKKEAVIFDPGGDGEKLNHWLEAEGIKPIAVILTHAHFDHIGAVDDIREKWGIEVYMHHLEKEWLGDASKNGSALFMMGEAVEVKDADHFIEEEGNLEIGSFTFVVLETPGHSPGSISLYHKESGVVFAGDVLFYGSIGRTDLPGGSYETLINSINEKLMDLPEETIVACGHGPQTTIRREMDTNPFLNGM